jgi:hypothetical protein
MSRLRMLLLHMFNKHFHWESVHQKCSAENQKIFDLCEGARLAMQTSVGGTCASWAVGSSPYSTRATPTNSAFSSKANPSVLSGIREAPAEAETLEIDPKAAVHTADVSSHVPTAALTSAGALHEHLSEDSAATGKVPDAHVTASALQAPPAAAAGANHRLAA